jgi:hypothetical protein
MYEPAPPFHETINKLLYAILQYFKGSPLNMTLPSPPYYNVTSDLLYAILNSLNGGSPVVYSQFRVLYVSARYGNDSTAEVNNNKKPYKTITAAKNNSFGNDIIHVMEGIYDEGNLFGTYFYWFDFGAEINYSGSDAIFHQWYGQCTVRGYGKFKCTGNGSVTNVGQWLFCILDMECESCEAISDCVILWQNNFIGAGLYKPHKVKTKRIYSQNGSGVHFRYNSYAEVEADEIICDSVNQVSFRGTVFIGNVNKGTIRNCRITGNHIAALHLGSGFGDKFEVYNCDLVCNGNLPLAHGIYQDGFINDFTLFSTKIACNSPSSRAIYSLQSINIHIDNNVNANVDTGGTVLLNYINKENKIRLTDNKATLDITGSTSIDLINYQNVEVIIITSSNAAETLSQIINAPKHHSYKIAPAPGLSLTVSSTSPGVANDTSIILESGSLLLKGDTGDLLELRNGLTGTGNRQVNASNY